jgi:hypothetical protein
MIEQKQRHAAFDAPDETEFARLYAATFDSSDDYETRLENRFITVAGGRLTLRRGELLHFNRDWLDREMKTINVPYYVPCECSYCVDQAGEYADGRELTAEEALEHFWSPKSEAGARAIYYGWSGQTIDAVEQFADVVGELDMDACTINRRVDTLAERAQVENLYPHALRAASAFFFADLGLEAHYIQALMGWRSIEVAVAYLRASGRQLAERIERAFAFQSIQRPDPIPREDVLPPADEAVAQTTDQGVTADPGATSLWRWDQSAES